MFRWLLLILVLLAALAGLALGALNPDPVTVDLALAEWQAALGTMLAAALGLGVVLGLVLALILFVLPARLRRRPDSGRKEPAPTTLPDA